jgi:hypothetical protein
VVMCRIMLSLAQRIPVLTGLTYAVSPSPKLSLQEYCAIKGEWDQEGPEDVTRGFLLWL